MNVLLAEMIAAGDATSAEVIDTHLARIVKVNSDVNAVTVTLARARNRCRYRVARARIELATP